MNLNKFACVALLLSVAGSQVLIAMAPAAVPAAPAAVPAPADAAAPAAAPAANGSKSLLGDATEYASAAASSAVEYAKAHPGQVALGVGAVAAAALFYKWLAGAAEEEEEAIVVNDEFYAFMLNLTGDDTLSLEISRKVGEDPYQALVVDGFMELLSERGNTKMFVDFLLNYTTGVVKNQLKDIFPRNHNQLAKSYALTSGGLKAMQRNDRTITDGQKLQLTVLIEWLEAHEVVMTALQHYNSKTADMAVAR